MGEAKRKRTPLVAPDDWQPLGNDVTTMVVVFGPATLRGGIPQKIVAALPRLTAEQRQGAMHEIVAAITANKHLDVQEAHAILTGAAALALSSELGESLRATSLAGATLTYTITPSVGGDNNWRLVVELDNRSPADDPRREIFRDLNRRS